MFGMSPWLTFGFAVITVFLLAMTIIAVVADWRRVQVAKHTGKAEPGKSE